MSSATIPGLAAVIDSPRIVVPLLRAHASFITVMGLPPSVSIGCSSYSGDSDFFCNLNI